MTSRLVIFYTAFASALPSVAAHSACVRSCCDFNVLALLFFEEPALRRFFTRAHSQLPLIRESQICIFDAGPIHLDTVAVLDLLAGDQ